MFTPLNVYPVECFCSSIQLGHLLLYSTGAVAILFHRGLPREIASAPFHWGLLFACSLLPAPCRFPFFQYSLIPSFVFSLFRVFVIRFFVFPLIFLLLSLAFSFATPGWFPSFQYSIIPPFQYSILPPKLLTSSGRSFMMGSQILDLAGVPLADPQTALRSRRRETRRHRTEHAQSSISLAGTWGFVFSALHSSSPR
jgi:hypothetical protein